MEWCRAKAKKANGERLMSGAPAARITAQDVWDIMVAARGRCTYCGSLAVQKRPSTSTGQPLPWAEVGRRIGSLSHLTPLFYGGTNTADNLGWSCLWCNTWRDERRLGATDHGGLQPDGDLCAIPGCGVTRPKEADLPLKPDQCLEHGTSLGELCATCLSAMRAVRSGHCLDTRTSLVEEYRHQHNQCPGCEPLTILPTTAEVHRYRKLVTAPNGPKGARVRMDVLGRSPADRDEEIRNAAKATRLPVDEYVLMIAQVPHRCDICEPDAARTPECVTRIADELARLRRVHGNLYKLRFNPLSLHPWQAKPLGTRHRPLEADSPRALRVKIGNDKQKAACRGSLE